MGLIVTALSIAVGLSRSPVGWTLPVILLAIGITLVVQDLSIKRRINHASPILDGKVYENDKSDGLLLAVTNSGAPAKVWAKLWISGDTLKARSDVYAVWNNNRPREYEVELAPGETKRIRIASTRKAAEIGPDALKYYWYVPFIENGEQVETRSRDSAFPKHPGYDPKTDPQALAVVQDVRVEVFSVPASVSPRIRARVKLIGCDLWEDLSLD